MLPLGDSGLWDGVCLQDMFLGGELIFGVVAAAKSSGPEWERGRG